MNENKELPVMKKPARFITEAICRADKKITDIMGRLMMTKAGRTLITLPFVLSTMTITAFADSGASGAADSTINQIITLLKTWIPRLGGLLVVVGGIQLGIGFKDDDATGKTRGMQCMIGGAIVAAIGTAVNF